MNYRIQNAGNASHDQQADGGEHAEESVIHDITGTTVYVVGVICVIPAAGLVAWVVRYVVKKKVKLFQQFFKLTECLLLTPKRQILIYKFILKYRIQWETPGLKTVPKLD